MVLHFLIQGRVQGVGFRWFVHREASDLELPRGSRVDRVLEHYLDESEAKGLDAFRIEGAW